MKNKCWKVGCKNKETKLMSVNLTNKQVIELCSKCIGKMVNGLSNGTYKQSDWKIKKEFYYDSKRS